MKYAQKICPQPIGDIAYMSVHTTGVKVKMIQDAQHTTLSASHTEEKETKRDMKIFSRNLQRLNTCDSLQFYCDDSLEVQFVCLYELVKFVLSLLEMVLDRQLLELPS